MTYTLSGVPPKRVLGRLWLIAILLFFTASPITAQSLRDPTTPPPELLPAVSRSAGALLGIESGAMTIIVKNGQPHLVIGNRFFAQGEKIGRVLIERITETEIWLREGGVLRKVPQFPGIQRRTVTQHAGTANCEPESSPSSSPVAACSKAQP